MSDLGLKHLTTRYDSLTIRIPISAIGAPIIAEMKARVAISTSSRPQSLVNSSSLGMLTFHHEP